jgi:hypothetical protein
LKTPGASAGGALTGAARRRLIGVRRVETLG